MKKYVPAAVVDVLLVLAFAAAGRRSHQEGVDAAGLLTTAWPFLTGAAVGWVATLLLHRGKFDARLVVPTGVLVWVCALVVGMGLRVVSGQGTAFSFVLVAASVLALFLIGWRALFRVAARQRDRSAR
ncbi:DUF3054 domain-containing protein [Prescottella subtropica]|uniref:DUF3054 domain-containing protein n=1 Tax=Prescottella subtropica TaxID=2545757 RepID=UPI0010FA3199|nr:DUF3054 domain-containing protein [Prescottella subtropica]